MGDYMVPYHELLAQRGSYNIPFFTVLCLLAWPLSGNESGFDSPLIQTSLIFIRKSYCFYVN